MVIRPAFVLDGMPRKPSPYITDAMWWFWVLLNRYDPLLELGGIFANKPGFHNTGLNNLRNWPLNYSIRDLVNRSGPWWKDFASAIDITFPEAQRGDYSRISMYSNRIKNSAKDPNDPRLDDNMYQFFGQTDNDSEVEGWNEYKEENSSSDPSHLWHIHDETQRNKCGDFDCMWAKLTVWMGWTVLQWRTSLRGDIDMRQLVTSKDPNDPDVWLSHNMLTRRHLKTEKEVEGVLWWAREGRCDPIYNMGEHGKPWIEVVEEVDDIEFFGVVLQDKVEVEIPEEVVTDIVDRVTEGTTDGVVEGLAEVRFVPKKEDPDA